MKSNKYRDVHINQEILLTLSRSVSGSSRNEGREMRGLNSQITEEKTGSTQTERSWGRRSWLKSE